MAAEYCLSNDHFSPMRVCENWLFLKDHADSPASGYFITLLGKFSQMSV